MDVFYSKLRRITTYLHIYQYNTYVSMTISTLPPFQLQLRLIYQLSSLPSFHLSAEIHLFTSVKKRPIHSHTQGILTYYGIRWKTCLMFLFNLEFDLFDCVHSLITWLYSQNTIKPAPSPHPTYNRKSTF